MRKGYTAAAAAAAAAADADAHTDLLFFPEAGEVCRERERGKASYPAHVYSGKKSSKCASPAWFSLVFFFSQIPRGFHPPSMACCAPSGHSAGLPDLLLFTFGTSFAGWSNTFEMYFFARSWHNW
jgi:hypothetical protein